MRKLKFRRAQQSLWLEAPLYINFEVNLDRKFKCRWQSSMIALKTFSRQTDRQTYIRWSTFFCIANISEILHVCFVLNCQKIDIQHCNKQVQITQKLIISPTKLQTFLQSAASNNLNHKCLDQKMKEFQVTKEVSFSIRQILSHPRKKET